VEEICSIKRKIRKYVVFFTFTVSVMAAAFIIATEKYIMPAAADICLIQAKETANNIINSAVDEVLKEKSEGGRNILSLETENGTTMIMADTISINLICAEISSSITEKIADMENNIVKVPYGAASGIGIFANSGPDLEFEIMPAGDTTVDYETEFTSAGINQTNYKIWLTVNITISLVNPIYDRNISMNRKIMLADTIIKGDLPSNYIDIPNI
jgi:sporulation protein YunB